jgi:cation transport regulator ChaB
MKKSELRLLIREVMAEDYSTGYKFKANINKAWHSYKDMQHDLLEMYKAIYDENGEASAKDYIKSIISATKDMAKHKGDWE